MLPRPLRNAPIGAIFEWRADQIALEIGRRVMRSAGAALVIDYGHVQSAAGDTFQAVGEQALADPLHRPGNVDLTAHVDFQALANAAESLGAGSTARSSRPSSCAELGIETRAEGAQHRERRSARSRGRQCAGAADQRARRTGMGRMFKAIAFGRPDSAN